jgi:hypothetical protein
VSDHQETQHEMPQPLEQVVDLARSVLRERGLSDEQIDVLLNRKTAPEHLI